MFYYLKIMVERWNGQNERSSGIRNGLYFLWTNGSLWKITTKAGSGRTVASGGENLVGSWPSGAMPIFSDEESKQAMFRLAVAFQDQKTTQMLFAYFNNLQPFPEDKLVAEVYLSMGDLPPVD